MVEVLYTGQEERGISVGNVTIAPELDSQQKLLFLSLLVLCNVLCPKRCMMWSISSEAVKSLREAPLLDRKDPPRPLSKWLIL